MRLYTTRTQGLDQGAKERKVWWLISQVGLSMMTKLQNLTLGYKGKRLSLVSVEKLRLVAFSIHKPNQLICPINHNMVLYLYNWNRDNLIALSINTRRKEVCFSH